MTDSILADRFSMCEMSLHQIPVGEKVYETAFGHRVCEECKTISESRQSRKECGAVTTKAHWKDEKKARSSSKPLLGTATEGSTARTEAPASNLIPE